MFGFYALDSGPHYRKSHLGNITRKCYPTSPPQQSVVRISLAYCSCGGGAQLQADGLFVTAHDEKYTDWSLLLSSTRQARQEEARQSVCTQGHALAGGVLFAQRLLHPSLEAGAVRSLQRIDKRCDDVRSTYQARLSTRFVQHANTRFVQHHENKRTYSSTAVPNPYWITQ